MHKSQMALHRAHAVIHMVQSSKLRPSTEGLRYSQRGGRSAWLVGLLAGKEHRLEVSFLGCFFLFSLLILLIPPSLFGFRNLAYPGECRPFFLLLLSVPQPGFSVITQTSFLEFPLVTQVFTGSSLGPSLLPCSSSPTSLLCSKAPISIPLWTIQHKESILSYWTKRSS